jgi:ribonuclease HII
MDTEIVTRMAGRILAGVDEAGRGPLFGSVFVAAVVLDPDRPVAGLRDSKKLTAKKRILLFDAICSSARAYSIVEVQVEEIDRLNILQASLVGMSRAVSALSVTPDLALVDGHLCPENMPCDVQAIVRGDDRVDVIAAASILAKVARDRQMHQLDRVYPGYGLARHKGYPTKAHLDALQSLGVTPLHRRTFAPVKKILEQA